MECAILGIKIILFCIVAAAFLGYGYIWFISKFYNR